MTSPYGTSPPRDAAPAIAAFAAAALLLAATPADAGLLSNGIVVGGVGHSVKKNLEETTGIFVKKFGAFLDEDDGKVRALSGELEKTQGKLIVRASPLLDATVGRLQSAKRKIERFVGGVGKAVNDARAALAFDRDERKGGGSGAAILGGGPLPATNATAFLESGSEPKASHAGAPGAWTNPGTGPSQSWAEWAANEHRTRPHCYGIVDLANLPADCPNREVAAKLAASGAAGTGQASQVAGADRGAGGAASKGGDWSKWETSAKHVSDVDRESARVSAFAVRCWGVSGVNEYHPFYRIMKKRMQSDDCPKEEAEGKSRGDARKDYASALSGTLGEDAAAKGGGDYRDALTALEAREAERRRLEAEERAQQARLAEQRRLEEERERQRQARLAEQRRIEEEHERQARLAERRRNISGGCTSGASVSSRTTSKPTSGSTSPRAGARWRRWRSGTRSRRR